MSEILIAEKDRYLLRVLTQGLQQPDRRLIALNDGEAILQRLREAAPDVLIVDTNIAPMGGEELCRRLQSQMPNRKFLTCVLTSSAEDEYGNYAEWFGNFRMLEKPVSVGCLRSYIDVHLIDCAA
jgi:CheY-like chemotaxis protein